MNPKAVMIDIEALSLRPNAHILQVGVVLADLATKSITPMLNVSVSGQQGRDVDPETVKWWMQQDGYVAAGVFDFDGKRVTMGAEQLFSALQTITDGATVWANPSTYDLVVLKDLFGGKTPWSHRQGMCLKTAVAILDPGGKHKPVDNDAAHDALADATWQMQYLCRLYDLAHPGVTAA